jgi:DNA-binding response OmpR family regulator
MNNILLVEDDKSLANTLEYYLTNEGFKITISSGVKEAKKEINNQNINLVILDINLPDGSGYDFCAYLRKHKDIPIIFLTALDEEENVVKGLDLGADDYIIKPFRAKELVSRIKSLLRRTNKIVCDYIKVQGVNIDLKQFKVYKDGEEKDFTALEYRLLVYLFENKNQVLTRQQILQELWDNSGKFVNDNTLTVYIKRIRKKIEDDLLHPKIIKTVKNIGYIVEDNYVEE